MYYSHVWYIADKDQSRDCIFINAILIDYCKHQGPCTDIHTHTPALVIVQRTMAMNHSWPFMKKWDAMETKVYNSEVSVSKTTGAAASIDASSGRWPCWIQAIILNRSRFCRHINSLRPERNGRHFDSSTLSSNSIKILALRFQLYLLFIHMGPI